MLEPDEGKQLQNARQSVARWLEYFKNIGAIEPKVQSDSDWEPLHIGFRGDDE